MTTSTNLFPGRRSVVVGRTNLPPMLVPDFVPRPEDLVFREEGVKARIAVSKRSVDFFKTEARKHNTQYQRMIRRLLDAYADHHVRSRTARASGRRAEAARQLNDRGALEGRMQEMRIVASPIARRSRRAVDPDPADRAQHQVAIGRAPILVAALARGHARPLTPLGSAAIKDHPHAGVAVERVGQRLVALGQVPGHDEQDTPAGWSRGRAVPGRRWCWNLHPPPAE